MQVFHSFFAAFVLGASLWLGYARSSATAVAFFGIGGLLLSVAVFFLGCAIAVGGAY